MKGKYAECTLRRKEGTKTKSRPFSKLLKDSLKFWQIRFSYCVIEKFVI